MRCSRLGKALANVPCHRLEDPACLFRHEQKALVAKYVLRYPLLDVVLAESPWYTSPTMFPREVSCNAGGRRYLPWLAVAVVDIMMSSSSATTSACVRVRYILPIPVLVMTPSLSITCKSWSAKSRVQSIDVTLACCSLSSLLRMQLGLSGLRPLTATPQTTYKRSLRRRRVPRSRSASQTKRRDVCRVAGSASV